MKKILILGGSKAQTISIQAAKELGYFSVLCDYLPDNPGRHIADTFHLVSTTDKEAVLSVAIQERVDGIIAYGSDPAAPTAAYVAEKMNLPGINYEVVRHFCEKHLFRSFLSAHGFNIPQSIEVSIPYDINAIDVSTLRFPLIVKPTDSSGSKGITAIDTADKLPEALRYAQEYSRNKTLIVEEFIVRDHPYVIEAEIFVLKGKVVSWGLINSIRDDKSNPLLPGSYSYPLDISPKRREIVKSEISRLIAATGETSGAFNMEMIIDKHDRLYFLDVGPRNGGNMLPEFISMISGKDVVKATILAAMGEFDKVDVEFDGEKGGFWGLGVLHSAQQGIFKEVAYSPLAKKSLVREIVQKDIGDKIRPFERCDDLVGLVFYRFDTKSEMDDVMCGMHESMKVGLE